MNRAIVAHAIRILSTHENAYLLFTFRKREYLYYICRYTFTYMYINTRWKTKREREQMQMHFYLFPKTQTCMLASLKTTSSKEKRLHEKNTHSVSSTKINEGLQSLSFPSYIHFPIHLISLTRVTGKIGRVLNKIDAVMVLINVYLQKGTEKSTTIAKERTNI